MKSKKFYQKLKQNMCLVLAGVMTFSSLSIQTFAEEYKESETTEMEAAEVVVTQETLPLEIAEVMEETVTANKQITALEIQSLPNTVDYLANDPYGNRLQYYGCKLMAYYSDRTTKLIDHIEDRMDVHMDYDIDWSKPGTYPVTITFEGKTVEFQINVWSKEVYPSKIRKLKVGQYYEMSLETNEVVAFAITPEEDGYYDFDNGFRSCGPVYSITLPGTDDTTLTWEAGKTYIFRLTVTQDVDGYVRFYKLDEPAPFHEYRMKGDHDAELIGSALYEDLLKKLTFRVEDVTSDEKLTYIKDTFENPNVEAKIYRMALVDEKGNAYMPEEFELTVEIPMPKQLYNDFFKLYRMDQSTDYFEETDYRINPTTGRLNFSYDGEGEYAFVCEYPYNLCEIIFNPNIGNDQPIKEYIEAGKPLIIKNITTANGRKVTFEPNGGKVSEKERHVPMEFKEWTTRPDGGSCYYPNWKITVHGDMTLYAQWSDPEVGELPVPTRAGYNFIGWYENNDYSRGFYRSNTDLQTDVTLYARWQKIESTGVEDFVTQLYEVCLNRKPDAVGLEDWSNKLKNKQIDGITAAYGFVFSSEFTSKNLCNEDYVKQLYKAFLGRTPDAVGLADWVNQLEKGTTREDIFNGFALSQEFKGLCEQYGIKQGKAIDVSGNGTVPNGKCAICGKVEKVTVDGVTGFVKRLYKVCLNRQADAAGLEDWTGKLKAHKATGRSVAYGFIFSQEFINKKYSNADYIEKLYEAFMGRGSDPAGKSDWLNRMSKEKWTREQVFDGFVGSQEFTNICKSYGITRD